MQAAVRPALGMGRRKRREKIYLRRHRVAAIYKRWQTHRRHAAAVLVLRLYTPSIHPRVFFTQLRCLDLPVTLPSHPSRKRNWKGRSELYSNFPHCDVRGCGNKLQHIEGACRDAMRPAPCRASAAPLLCPYRACAGARHPRHTGPVISRAWVSPGPSGCALSKCLDPLAGAAPRERP